MATPFDQTPVWFDAEYYLGNKLAQLQAADPKANWTRESMNKAFVEAGFANPFDHYLVNGDSEGLNPNAKFNAEDYLNAKVAQLGSTYTKEMVIEAIHGGGMTYAQHYAMYGAAENINPSKAFSQAKYLEAKVDQLKTAGVEGDWTPETVLASMLQNGMTPLTHFLLYAAKEGLDKYDYSEGGAPIPHPGNTVTLTAGVDVATPEATVAELKTSTRDDVILAATNSVTSKATLNPGDVIDGGAGVDTLKVDMLNGSFNGFKDGSVKNVEYVELNKAEGRTFDAKGVEGVQEYAINGGATGTMTLKNVDSTATKASLTQEKGTFSFQFVDSAVAGNEDVASITLNGVGIDKDNRVTVQAKGANAGKVETLVLEGETGKSNFVKADQAHTGVAVAGAGNVNVVVDSNAIKAFDASAATGKVVADLTKGITTLKTIEGGAGDDTITVAGLATGAVANGGGGADTLKFSGVANNAVIGNAISGFETFDYEQNATTQTITFNLAKTTDLATFKLTGTGTADDTVNVIGAKTLGSHNLVIENTLNNTGGAGGFNYDGTESLNISHIGDGTGTATKLHAVTANTVTQVNIENKADEGMLTISTLNADKAEALNINTGNYGVAVGAFNSGTVREINFTGDFAATFSGSTAGKLENVNAESLYAKLDLDLSAVTPAGAKGVTVKMGSYGADLVGTAKQDTFILGDGHEVVSLVNSATAGTHDKIQGFATGAGGDDIQLDGFNQFMGKPAAAQAAALGNVIVGKNVTDPLTEIDATDMKTALTGLLKGDASNAVSGSMYAVLSDGTNLGVYHVDVNFTAGATDCSTAINSVNLIGIIESSSADSLHTDNFIA